jgi:IS30 family transposase
MDIFKLLYVERLTPSATAAALNRKPSSITREIAKGMDSGMYNPVIAEAGCMKVRRNQRPRLKMTDEAWSVIKPQLETRRPPEEVAKQLKKEYPDYAVSGKTIYNYVFFHMKGELKKPALQDLRLRGKAGKKGKEGEKRGKIPGMTLTATRPFVFEFDDLTKEEQLKLIEKHKKLIYRVILDLFNNHLNQLAIVYEAAN